MSFSEGFLVVLKTPEDPGLLNNKRYRGIFRMPYYRLEDQNPIESEIEAMDRYVFGDARDEESGLIPNYDLTRDLLSQFSNSHREFEIIWCRSVSDMEEAAIKKTATTDPGQLLGFDLAALGGEFWSIVADFPGHKDVADFFDKLNENGLFNTAADAQGYLKEYRRLKLPDHDDPFEVLEVRLVESK